MKMIPQTNLEELPSNVIDTTTRGEFVEFSSMQAVPTSAMGGR